MLLPPVTSLRRLKFSNPKRKGGYNIVEIDPEYIPEPTERKQVFGITFEQGRNNFKIDNSLLNNIVTENKNIPESAPPRPYNFAYNP